MHRLEHSYEKTLIQYYENIFNKDDMANGDTPLHLATSSEKITEVLEAQGCDINATNSKGYTALHNRVQDDCVECIITLLSNGANINTANKDGNTPLHEANSPIVLQALLVFGANIQAVNNENKNPCHLIATSTYKDKDKMLHILHAIGSPRCTRRLQDCTEGCAPNGSFNGTSSDDQKLLSRSRIHLDEFLENVNTDAATLNLDHNSRNGGRILCLDGGGIKGLVSIQLLLAIQEAAGGRPILELFEWITGTSTGAILALALASGKTPEYAQGLYFRMKNIVFDGKRPYGANPLEELLKEEFGERTVMSDIKGVKVIVTAVLTTTTPADLHLFRNYDTLEYQLQHPNQNAKICKPTHSPNEQLVWKAARASGAAPTYFKAFGPFIDGGLIANNPTLDVLTEITEYSTTQLIGNPALDIFKPKVVVSLGTSSPPLIKVEEDCEDYLPTSRHWLKRAWKTTIGLTDICKVLLNQITMTDNRVVDRARSWCAMCNIPYIRLSPQLSNDVEMDETDDENLIKMLWETMVYINEKKEQIQKFANILTHGTDVVNLL